MSEGVTGDVRGKGEEGVAESSPTPVGLTEEINGIMICSEEVVEEEESLREEKVSETGDASAMEGMVRLRKRFQEPVSSEKEPLHDFLKRVSDSYNPKKKKSPGVKIHEKASAESKTKATAKGKKKVGEPSETIEIEEMDLVLHDEDEAEEVEVLTPSAKKIKTFKKKSPAKSIDTKSSILPKRTRSAKKSRKVQIVEKENNEEEMTDEEKDNEVKFGKRTILKGRLLKVLGEE
ncbi:uncharacterized protein [Nicotiana tomentosiformis]|uniref:uncharacterized protein n=1 Tax=Nicotiana tomentosiformis TaxID=4098 RepID=UPI00388C6275